MRLGAFHNRVANTQRQNLGKTLTSLALLLSLMASATILAHAQTYTILHNFGAVAGDGGYPSDNANLISDAAGNLYGSTGAGGAGYGTIYKIDAAGNYSLLHTFNLTDGSGPQGALVRDTAGNLYGITQAGGTLFDGVVFKLDTTGNLTVLYNVPGQARAGLVMDAAGNLYGTLFLGGDFGNGEVFKLDPSGNATVLHSFGAIANDGMLPSARVVLDAAGNIYGTATNGGALSYGIVFKIDTAGNYSVLHDFNNTDGAFPSAGLTLDAAGNIYGTTFDGGANGIGEVFKLDTANNLTVLHSFNSADGAKPISDLIRDSAGNLYGTTALNGAGGFGNVFKLDTAGNLTSLHDFTDTPDGREPNAGLLVDAAGTFYGVTVLGGSAGVGTVFKLTQSAQLNNFSAQVVVSNHLHSTAVTGQFNSTSSIDPTTQGVSLSIAGAHSFSVSFTPGSFKKVFGGYVATGKVGSAKVSMLLVPLNNGNWSYSAALLGFVPGSTSVTVSLTVGNQTGSATVNAHIFN